MEIAVVGVLGNMITMINGNTDKQRAFFKADAAVAVVAGLVEMVNSVAVCEKALLVSYSS